jgi:integrase
MAEKSRRRGSIVQRGEGRWLVRVYVGTDPKTGKRSYVSESIRGGKRDADRILTKLLGKGDSNSLVKPTRETVAEYLERWLSTTAVHNVRAHSLADYRWLAVHYINPFVGPIRLHRLTLRDIEERMIAGLRDKRLSRKSISMAHGLLSAALRDAVRLGICPANPAANTKLPKAQPRERKALSVQEVARFREATKGSPHHVFFGFQIDTGCRPSEALALRWEDVDLEAGTVTIRRSLSKGAKGVPKCFQDPKTESSRRTIALAASIIAELRTHRAQRAAARLAAGPAYTDLGLVFAGETGKPLDEKNLNGRHLKSAAAAAGLDPAVSLYSLRHTCATLLITAGVAPNIVAERLGHKTTETTFRNYVHAAPGGQAVAAAQMERLLTGNA